MVDFPPNPSSMETPMAKKRRTKWITLKNLRAGAIFETKDGIRAVKSENRYGGRPDAQFECIRLNNGSRTFFEEHNQERVREIPFQG